MRRRTREEKFMDEAIRCAKKGLSEGEVPIGAVIVYENKVVARGYNRRAKLQLASAHAEMMAIVAACLKEQKGVPEGKFTAGCAVTAEVSLKGTAEGSQTIETAALQIDGQWYCAMIYVYDEGAYVGFEIEMMIGG